jgi:hypothetical protein
MLSVVHRLYFNQVGLLVSSSVQANQAPERKDNVRLSLFVDSLSRRIRERAFKTLRALVQCDSTLREVQK